MPDTNARACGCGQHSAGPNWMWWNAMAHPHDIDNSFKLGSIYNEGFRCVLSLNKEVISNGKQ